MLQNLTIIDSVYCCVRLMEMMSSNAVPKLKAIWALMCVVAIAAIAYCCIDTVRRGTGDATLFTGRPLALSASDYTVKSIFGDVDVRLPTEPGEGK